MATSEKQVTSGEMPPVERPGKHGDPGAEPQAPITLPVGLAARITRVLGLGRVWQWLVQPRVIGVVIVGDATKKPEGEETRRGSDYRILPIDLAVARDKVVVLKDQTVAAIWVDDISAGATAFVHIGNRDPINFSFPGKGFEVDPNEEANISVTNTAQGGAILQLGVAFGVRPL